AAKAALDTMTLSLARVLGPAIRVLCVSPAAVATDFVAGRGRPQLEKIAEGTPLKRVVEPEDIARTVMACITHLKVSTGARIIVCAGRFLATKRACPMLDLGPSFLASVARDPDALAIVDGEVRLTYRDWYRKISALVAALDRLGLKAGDHLVTVLQNRWQA